MHSICVVCFFFFLYVFFFVQAEDGIRDLVRSRGLGDVYKRQVDGDLICDTENCIYTFDCTSTTNPCTEEEWIVVDVEHGYTVLNNYMGYTDCPVSYTHLTLPTSDLV